VEWSNDLLGIHATLHAIFLSTSSSASAVMEHVLRMFNNNDDKLARRSGKEAGAYNFINAIDVL